MTHTDPAHGTSPSPDARTLVLDALDGHARRVATQMDRVHVCDALQFMRALPDNFVHCIVTSPPYYGLRDYGIDGQIGLEDTPTAYVAQLVEIFDEARRVLRSDGTMWVNIGDSYASDVGGKCDLSRGQFSKHARVKGYEYHIQSNRNGNSGLPAKNLIGTPWRLAFALQDAGWWLRSDIIWHKPNPMPESVTDRCSVAHEYVFMLTKSAHYFYDADAIRTPLAPKTFTTFGCDHLPQKDDDLVRAKNWSDSVTVRKPKLAADGNLAGANKRTVWTVATEPSPFPHFAMFPQKLIEPMILAGCPARVCPVCGKGWERVTERHALEYNTKEGIAQAFRMAGVITGGTERVTLSKTHLVDRRDLGFRPACTCNADHSSAGIVLDMFMGTGTTALVAQRLGRHFIGCDLNAAYVDIARQRIAYHGDDKRLLAEQAAGVAQMPLFESRADPTPAQDAQQLALFAAGTGSEVKT